MTQVESANITVWRETKPGAYVDRTIPREEVRIGDIIYDMNRQFYGRILEMKFKEPGRYSDMEFLVQPEPNFFVFPRISPN
jgi:hypothetical protein